jgi:CRP/FNR family transcriptional regulator
LQDDLPVPRRRVEVAIGHSGVGERVKHLERLRKMAGLQQTAINAFGSVKQPVAAHLLDLASAQQRPRGRLVARVSQQELADAVGSVREVVARVLRELRLAAIVATGPDSVVILDAARLHRESWSSSAL